MCKNTNWCPAFQGSRLSNLRSCQPADTVGPSPSYQEGTPGVLPQLVSYSHCTPASGNVANGKWEGLYFWKRPTQIWVSPAPADSSKCEKAGVEGSI